MTAIATLVTAVAALLAAGDGIMDNFWPRHVAQPAAPTTGPVASTNGPAAPAPDARPSPALTARPAPTPLTDPAAPPPVGKPGPHVVPTIVTLPAPGRSTTRTTVAPTVYITGAITSPVNSTSESYSYVDAQVAMAGTVTATADQSRLFVASRLTGSTDGRTITEAMKDPAFVYPVSMRGTTWVATAFCGRTGALYSGLVFDLYLLEAGSAGMAEALRGAPGQAFSFSEIRTRVRQLDAHTVVRA